MHAMRPQEKRRKNENQSAVGLSPELNRRARRHQVGRGPNVLDRQTIGQVFNSLSETGGLSDWRLVPDHLIPIMLRRQHKRSRKGCSECKRGHMRVSRPSNKHRQLRLTSNIFQIV